MSMKIYWLVLKTFVDHKNQQYPECAFITASMEGRGNNFKLSRVDGNLIFQCSPNRVSYLRHQKCIG